MNAKLRQCLAVFAVAAILAYMGLISLTHLKDYVAWPADMLALSLAAALSGTLLAMAEPKAVLLYIVASFASVPLFGGFWAYTSWALLGGQIPAFDLLLSDVVFTYTFQRSFLLVAPSLVFGLLGVLGVQLFLPKLLRH